MAERRTVDANVAGSSPVIRPFNQVTLIQKNTQTQE